MTAENEESGSPAITPGTRSQTSRRQAASLAQDRTGHRDLTAALRRRKLASLRLPPLEDGRHDPWERLGEPEPGPVHPCGSTVSVPDTAGSVRLTCSTRHCRHWCVLLTQGAA